MTTDKVPSRRQALHIARISGLARRFALQSQGTQWGHLCYCAAQLSHALADFEPETAEYLATFSAKAGKRAAEARQELSRLDTTLHRINAQIESGDHLMGWRGLRDELAESEAHDV